MSNEPQATTCPNCGTSAAGRWCHECGQDNLRARLRTRDVLARTAGALVDLDSTLWRTLRGLTRNPGGFAREYVRGRRMGRFPPFRYALATFALAMLVSRVFIDSLSPPIDPATPNLEQMEAANRFLTQYLQIPLFAGIPAAALSLRVLYRKAGFNFAECFVLLCYTLGHVSLLGLLLLPLGRVSYWGWVGAGWGLQMGYLLWASRAFFGVPWFHVVWRTLVMLVIYTVAMMAVAMVMVVGFMIVQML